MPEEKSTPSVKDLGEIIEGITKNVPLYPDLLQPGAQETGQAIATLLGLVNTVLTPFAAANLYSKAKIERLKQTLAEKTSHIPAERIQDAPINILGPAIEAMRFTQDDPDLTELYANLIATSIDRDSVENSHPAFVEAIKQLSPDEAKIIALFAPQRSLPLLTIRSVTSSPDTGMTMRFFLPGGGNYGYRNIMSYFSHLAIEAGCVYPDKISLYLNNLCRLGLAEIHPDTSYLNSSIYNPLLLDPIFRTTLRKASRSNGSRIETVKQLVHVTELGRQFYNVCVVGPEESNSESARWSSQTKEIPTISVDPREVAKQEVEHNNRQIERLLK